MHHYCALFRYHLGTTASYLLWIHSVVREAVYSVIFIGLRTASWDAKLHFFDIIMSLQQGFFLINLRSICFLSWLMGGKHLLVMGT
jgi:hypothetical protein